MSYRMHSGGLVGNNDMEIRNAEAEKSIDVSPLPLSQVIQSVPNKLLHSKLN